MYRFIPSSAWHNGRGWDFQIWRLVSQAHYGGGHFNEISRVIDRLQPDDPESWYTEWQSLGEQLRDMAETAARAGHGWTEGRRLLRASNYFRIAEFFLAPTDNRRADIFQSSVDCFAKGCESAEKAVEPVQIPYEAGHLKGFWCQGATLSTDRHRGSIVFIGGLDSTAEELYFTGYGLLERGYALLIVEGPGQGAMLRTHGMSTRHDYEGVGTACYDWLADIPNIDIDRIALIGMSLGGYYSLRIGAYEHRYKALVSWSPIENYYAFWEDRSDEHNLAAHVRWVFGAKSMSEAREKMKKFDVSDLVPKIRCPTLLCVAEQDGSPLALEQARSVYDKLTCPKTWAYFTEQEGGALHCEQDHLTLANEVIGDWLDETLRV